MTKHKKKKQKSGMFDDYAPTFALAGGSMGMAVVGGKLQKHLPAGTPNAMTTGGSAMAGMIPITATMGGASGVSKQLKKLIKSMKGIK